MRRPSSKTILRRIMKLRKLGRSTKRVQDNTKSVYNYIHVLYAFGNRTVFRSDLKESKVSEECIWAGNWFHIHGPLRKLYLLQLDCILFMCYKILDIAWYRGKQAETLIDCNVDWTISNNLVLQSYEFLLMFCFPSLVFSSRTCS